MTIHQPTESETIKLLDIVEASTVNAVAKNAIEFHSSVGLSHELPAAIKIESSLATFERGISSNGSPNEFVVAARKAGLEIDIIPESFRFDPRVIFALRELVQRHAPDVILTHHVKSHFLIKLSRLSQQCHWVAFHHGYTTTDRKTRAYNYLDRWSLPSADRVITVCQSFAKDLADAGVPAERISVQHNSIRPQPPASPWEVKELKTRFGIAEDERVILAVGRLSQEKGHLDLISAFGGLRNAHPDLNARLVIVGDGPERGRLEAAVSALGLSERVIFTGHTNNVRVFYAAADLLALPSHSEGSPNVLLEAMAAGVPIVATTVGGVPEMVEDTKSALLVSAGDPPAMATAMAYLLTDKELARRLAANASALVSERHTPESYVNSLLAIYRKVVSNSKR
jgi:glycosyltransferase involved in cell wall biosynthesis